MTIYTHWVYDPVEQQHTKEFFSSKTEQGNAAKKARNEGKQVVAEFKWPVEPTASAVVDFCREQMKLREFDNPEPDEPATEKDSDISDLL